jgi:antitoxin VapB
MLPEVAMALNLKSREAHELAKQLAELTGQSMTQSVVEALREAVARRTPRTTAKRELLERIADHCAALPVLDDRTPEQILGYDDHGLPR